METKLFTISEASRLIGVSNQTLRTWVAKGLIPCTRLPTGYLRWSPEQVSAIRDQMAAPAAVQAAG